MCSVSLEATIHIYNLKKFPKIQKFITFTSTCPKSLNPIYGSPRPLGVNMSTKANTHNPYHLQDQMFKVDEKVLFPKSMGIAKFWTPKKPFLLVDMEWSSSYSCSYVIRYLSTKSHICMGFETLGNKIFSTRGYAKIHI